MSPTYYVYPGLVEVKTRKRPKEWQQHELDRITNLVAEHLNINKSDLISRQTRKFADVRKIISYLARVTMNLEVTQIAIYLEKDHTTIISTLNGCYNLMETNESFSKLVYSLSQKLIS